MWIVQSQVSWCPTVATAGPGASSRSAHCLAHLCQPQASVCFSLDLCFPKGINYDLCHLSPPTQGTAGHEKRCGQSLLLPFLRHFTYLGSHSPGISMGLIAQLRSKFTTSPFRRNPSGLCPYGQLPGMRLLATFPIPSLILRGPLSMLHPPPIATITLWTLSSPVKALSPKLMI